MSNVSLVEVGQRYVGWGKTWIVTKVWPQTAAEIRNVDRPENTMRLPLSQFKQLEEQR